MRQLDIIARETRRLQQDAAVLGVMLTGSFAGDYAAQNSDIDLYILGREDRFTADWVDGVMVEISFATPASARTKLHSTPMEVYRWQGAKILHDPQGLLAELAEEARQVYETYAPPEDLRQSIAHWLVSLELKLSAALAEGDMLKAGYLASTNAWKLLEAMWTVNRKPTPPASAVFRGYAGLRQTPCETWFQDLFEGTVEQRATHELRIISWLVPKLKGNLE